jgi:hypothetical protein
MTSVANPVGEVAVLGQQRECFAALVAGGVSYRVAAERVGFSRDYGWDLMQEPAVRQRVTDLVQQPVELIRAGLEVELIQLRNRAAGGDLTDADRADIELRLKLLLAHAKLRGWIVEKKQVARASIDLGRLSLEDLQSHVGQFLDVLEPGARREIELRVKALGERRSRLKRALGPAVEAPAENSMEGTGRRP